MARAFAAMSSVLSGSAIHEPLAAIENLTPVKTVPDELKQLPTKLPKIKTFDAASRCVLVTALCVHPFLTPQAGPGRVPWATQQQQQQAPAGTAATPSRRILSAAGLQSLYACTSCPVALP
jgi:hypothetical protein